MATLPADDHYARLPKEGLGRNPQGDRPALMCRGTETAVLATCRGAELNVAPSRSREITQDYFRRPEWRGYLLGLLAWGVAFALRFGLAPWFPPGFPYLTFFPAVVLVAYYAGLRPAIMTATLSGLAAWWFWIGPQGFDFGVATLVAMGFFLFIVAVDIFFIVGMDGASRRLSREVARNAALAESRDIAKEQAEAANRAKSVFLATMSHEIRTPLNGVLGMAHAMAASELSDVQRQQLEVILDSGKALLGILNDVLDLSKVEAGKVELEHIDFDLEHLLQSACAPYAALAHGNGVTLEIKSEEVSGWYRGDPTRVRQVITNLVANAVKFTSSGTITVAGRAVSQGVELSVTDSGDGIAADALQHVFAPFAQADTSTTRRHGGTGLGLSIVRELAELMGGEVVVMSELGHGSCFRVRLPLARLTSNQTETTTVETEEIDFDRSIRVLAAEDNQVNRFVLKTLLNQFGIEPTITVDGKEALEAWRSADWDVILMDMQMPIMDGLQATRAIRSEERALNRGRTPILALTANAMPHQVADCLASGMDAFVAKPIDVSALMSAIHLALQPSHASPPLPLDSSTATPNRCVGAG